MTSSSPSAAGLRTTTPSVDPPPADVGWTERQADGVLTLHGEFDSANRNLLAEATAAFAAQCIDDWHGRDTEPERSTDAVIDLGELRFVDAATLGVLVSMRHTLADAGIRLRTRRASLMLRRLSDICDLDGVLGLDPRPATGPTS